MQARPREDRPPDLEPKVSAQTATTNGIRQSFAHRHGARGRGNAYDSPGGARASTLARSVVPRCQRAARTLAFTWSAEVAPAITDATTGRVNLQRRPKCDPVMALWVIHPGRPARARRRRDRDPPRARSAILNRDGRPGHLSAIHAGYWSISAAMMDLAIPRRRRVRPTLAAHDGGTPRPRRR